MSDAAGQVFTVGHSTHGWEAFVSLLRQHGVEAVADVRSSPFSRFNPQYNRDVLEAALKATGIRYVFLGRELGARSEDPSCYVDGQVQYGRLAQTALFQGGLERVLRGAAKYRVALMCAEKEPLECHRTLLVAKELAARGVEVQHIHADGRLESHEEAMDRLVTLAGLPKDDLFRTKETLVAEAMARQEKLVAFVDHGRLGIALREDVI
jgi:uncharacterized protein (DUF488 family)